MANGNKYQVDLAPDDLTALSGVLQNIATREGHNRIVSITWQPSRLQLDAGYTIVSEMDA